MSGSFAIITPSFAPDFERCRLLAESVLRHAAEHVEHYIVVDRRDQPLFSRLSSARPRIVLKEDILPWWLHALPLSRRWWISLRGMPVRGWIVQQIVKLSAPEICGADTYLFLDSDAFLVRPYDPRRWIKDGRFPMFREVLAEERSHNDEWHRVAARLLGVPEHTSYLTNYVTQLVTWRRENVLKLHRHLEDRLSRYWVESLLKLYALSEYVLYGVYCEHVLGESSGHYFEATPDTLNYWKTKKLSDAELEVLRARLRPEHVAIMVSTKSNTPVEAIRRVFGIEPA
jgi:hypothetical protein